MHAIESNVHIGTSDHILKLSQWTSSISPRTSQIPNSKTSILKIQLATKNVKVLIDNKLHEISLTNEPVTCGWLLQKVRAIFEKSGHEFDPEEPERIITALKTENSNETLDFYLTLHERYIQLKT